MDSGVPQYEGDESESSRYENGSSMPSSGNRSSSRWSLESDFKGSWNNRMSESGKSVSYYTSTILKVVTTADWLQFVNNIFAFIQRWSNLNFISHITKLSEQKLLNLQILQIL